ncbi:MAG: GNAT family N-acetyltransferase, partial [Acidimicrobiia bacterium]|nr:GNAT family N-acetyltransferase [Acidimicrobiia bacterium]
DGFARDFHEQLCDVFAKQQLVPTYGLERVEKLVEHIGPTGQLLCLRARDADGRCIATGVYPAFGDFAFFWGNASERSYQHLRPNEAINWYAMRHWKARGIRHFDWGGGGDYKAKYGGRYFEVPLVFGARYPVLSQAVRVAESAYYGGREAQASVRRLWARRRPSSSPSAEDE